MPTLYDITDKLADLLGRADDGEIDDTLAEELDAWEAAFAVKAEAIVKAIRNLDASAEARREEARRLTTAAVGDERRVEWLKSYLMGQLERLNLTKADAGLFKIRIQRNGQPSIHYDGEPEFLPERFQMSVVKVRTSAIIDAWKDGQELPPHVTVEVGTHLRIN